jgi:hypothetical protein
VFLDQFSKILGLVLLAIGPCALVYSVVAFVRTRGFIRRSVEVTGEVIRLERTSSGGRNSFMDYAPVFSFTALDGSAHTVTSDVSSSPPDFGVGESVRVRYDPANPQSAKIHSFFQTWGAAVISGLVGAGFVAVGWKFSGLAR